MKEHIKTFKKFINEQVQEKITVTFKELYMKNEVTRTCVNMSKEDVITTYGLNQPDIECINLKVKKKSSITKISII